MFGAAKSSFGSGSASSFGSFGNTSNTTPFVAPTFGKQGSGNYGNSATFGGQQTTPTIFGSNSSSTQSSGLFAGSAGTSFGSTSNAPTFKGFSQPGSNSSVFGSTVNPVGTPTVFNQSANSAFGSLGKPNFTQPAPTHTGSTLFGNSATLTTSAGYGGFGQNNSTSLHAFGNSTLSAFGQNSTMPLTLNTGTSIAKYQCTIGTDTLMKGGQPSNISTKLHCITAMKEYEPKSLEELRYEDFISGRKHSQPTVSSGNFFCAGSQNTLTNTTSGLFGTGPPPTNNIFGGTGGTAETKNVFSQNSFGHLSNPNIFGTTVGPNFLTKSFGSGNASGFGSNSSETNPFLPKSAFGQTSIQGPFGKTQCASSSFGQTNTNCTAFRTSPTAQTPVLFATNTTADSNKLSFGISSNTSTGFSGFTTTSSNNSGLFGAKPSGNFGVTSSTNPGFGTFSANNSATGNNGIFGNNSNKCLNNFATYTGISSNPPTSLPITNNYGGLFATGSKPVSFFAATSTASYNNNTTSGIFGSSSSLFSAPGAGNTSFGGSIPANTGNNSLLNQKSPTLHENIMSKLTSPFGDSPIFKDLIRNDSDASSATDPLSQQALLDATSKVFKVDTKPAAPVLKIKPLCGPINRKALFDGLEEFDNAVENFNIKTGAKRLVLHSKPKMAEKAQTHMGNNTSSICSNAKVCSEDNTRTPGYVQKEASCSNQQRQTPPSNSKELVCESWLNNNKLKEKDGDEGTFSHNNTLAELIPNIEDFVRNQKSHQKLVRSVDSQQEIENDGYESINDESTNKSCHSVQKEIHPTGITLIRTGYYTIPTLNELLQYLLPDGSCIVPNFTVGRKGYGNVFFNNGINVAGLNLDGIVHFRNKEVIIYPDDENKPIIGEGLNREAQVTLDQVWPHDKTKHEPIKDPVRLADMDWEGKLRRVCSKNDTRFIEYRPETGSWVFLVKHFSKYGLSESDEDDQPAKQAALTVPQDQHIKVNSGNTNVSSVGCEVGAARVLLRNETFLKSDIDKLHLMRNSLFEKENGQVTYENSLESRTLHSFHTDFKSTNQEPMVHEPNKFRELEILDFKSLSMVQTATSYNSLTNTLYDELEFKTKVPLLDENEGKDIVAKDMNKLCTFNLHPKICIEYNLERPTSLSIPHTDHDSGYLSITLDEPFKIGFKKCAILAAPHIFNRVNVFSYCSEFPINNSEALASRQHLADSILPHMQVELNNSEITKTSDGLPCARPRNEKDSIREHLNATQICPRNTHLWQYETSLWSLMNILWSEYGSPYPGETSTHSASMYRRQLLSSWLESSNSTNKKSAQLTNTDYLNTLLSLLLRHDVNSACSLALKNGDLNMALLISQLPAGNVVCKLLTAQLREWEQNSSDKFIHWQRLIIYVLVSGESIAGYTRTIVNDWIEFFSVAQWYLTSPSSCIADVVTAYEKSFKCKDASSLPPLPPYWKPDLYDNIRNLNFDMRFHLLNLFCNSCYPLEILLSPSTHTNDNSDYSLSWLVLQRLQALGYNPSSVTFTNGMHVRYASQLEDHGLWEWSLYVLLHITDRNQRDTVVQEKLIRYVVIPNNMLLTEKEKFVVNKLCLPETLIYNAKSVKAGVSGQHMLQVMYLLKAQQWTLARKIMCEHVAPIYILKENFSPLRTTLFELDNKNLSNWDLQGGVFLKFISVMEKLRGAGVCKENIHNIEESATYDITEMCSRVHNLPVPTSYHLLSRISVGKFLAQVLRIVPEEISDIFLDNNHLVNLSLVKEHSNNNA